MQIPTPGQLLDRRYRVIHTLARGGFGQTYIAEDTRRPGNPKCVVKHLKPAREGFLAPARRLFMTEAETLEQLGHHDQIPRLLAYFEQDEEFYLVQELVEGHPLIQEIKPNQPWTENQVCHLLQEVLIVLTFVHSQGVIHRDIKPENLIRRDRDNKLVLVDFGTVKKIRDPLAGQLLSSPTISIGTLGYVANEQVQGYPRLNSDLYSLGVTAIHALTGCHPIQLGREQDTLELIWQDLCRQIDPDLGTILARLVRQSPEKRYQDATDVLKDLEPLIKRYPIAPPPNSSSLSEEFQQHQPLTQVQPILQTTNNFSIGTTIITSESEGKPEATNTTRGRTGGDAETSLNISTRIEEHSKFTSKLATLAIESLKRAGVLTTVLRRKWKLSLGLTVPIALIGAGVTSFHQMHQQGYLEAQTTLKQATILQTNKDYGECVQQAQSISQEYSELYALARILANECQFNLAEQLANQGSYRDAIIAAGEIPPASSIYDKTQALISQWSERILILAEEQYQAGELEDAVKRAEAVPQDTPTYDTAQKAIVDWQQAWRKNEELLDKANDLIEQQQWQMAIDTAKQVTTDYWEQQAASILQRANEALAASRTPPPSPPSTAKSEIPISYPETYYSEPEAYIPEYVPEPAPYYPPEPDPYYPPEPNPASSVTNPVCSQGACL